MQVDAYVVPKGYIGKIDMMHISDSDVEWFTKNNIKVSVEELANHEIVVYARTEADVDCENEIVVLANGRFCQETMAQLRTEAEIKFT